MKLLQKYQNSFILGISMFFLLVFVIQAPSVYATGYLSNPFKLENSPTLCEIEPVDKKLPYIGPMMLSTTHNSVNEWMTMLNQGSNDKALWYINEIQIPLKLQKSYNYTSCDIQIRYLPKPSAGSWGIESVGTISYDFKNKKALIEIYYLEIDGKLVPSLSGGYDLVQYYSDSPMSYERLLQTISHELGHGLGLGHFNEVNPDMIKRWNDGIDKPPSVMVEMQGVGSEYFSVTQSDIEQIKLKYGSNGFGEKKFLINRDNAWSNAKVVSTAQLVMPPSDPNCPNDGRIGKGFEPLVTLKNEKTGMAVRYSYLPLDLYHGCVNVWTLDFVYESSPEEHLFKIYYDIFIQQDEKRSLAKLEGKDSFFAPQGKGVHEIMVKEKEGVQYYWIVVYSTFPGETSENQITGHSLLFLNTAHKVTPLKNWLRLDIPIWVKTVAQWWYDGKMSDSQFLQTMQFLSLQGILNVPENKFISNSFLPFTSGFKEDVKLWLTGDLSDNEFLANATSVINDSSNNIGNNL